jgi:hypothetical protein
MVESSSPTNYLIKGPWDNGNSVELWTTVRLPFEPKEWLLEMRNSLKLAIRDLQSGDNTILNAIYSSNQREFVDIENVLIYNVGTAAFRHLCNKGLRFERRIASPPEISIKFNESSIHHHYYGVTNREAPSLYWKKEVTLACWKDITFPPIKGENNPHFFWYAMKKGSIEVTNEHPFPSEYGIRVIIKSPIDTEINLASVIKPLLDGIISSFHMHDGTDILEITKRLSKLVMNEESAASEEMLASSQTAVLGRRNLLHRFRQGLQWNPADDSCMMAEILLDDSLEKGKWSLSGEIYTIKKVTDSQRQQP